MPYNFSRTLNFILIYTRKGFKPGKTDKNKDENFGIIGMKERAEILRGGLHIKTKAGSGTSVSFNIPIDKTDENTGGA